MRRKRSAKRPRAFLGAVPAAVLGSLLKPHELHCVVLLGRAFRTAYERFLVARTTHNLPMALLALRSSSSLSSSSSSSSSSARAAWVRSLAICAPRVWQVQHGLIGPGAVPLPQGELCLTIQRGLPGLSAATVGTPEQATALPARVRHLTWDPALGSTGRPGDWLQPPLAGNQVSEEAEEEEEKEEEDDAGDSSHCSIAMTHEKEGGGGGGEEDARGKKRKHRTRIGALPPHLESLVAPLIPYSSWGALPTALRTLVLSGPGLTLKSSSGRDFDFRTLPRLQELRIFDLTTWPLNEFAARAPGLRVLHINRCASMWELLPGSLPKGLESLALANFNGTLHRGSLPAGLRNLCLHGGGDSNAAAAASFALPLAFLPDNLVQLDLRRATIESCCVPQSAAPSRSSLRTLRLRDVTGYDAEFWPHVTALVQNLGWSTNRAEKTHALAALRALTSLEVSAFAYTHANLFATTAAALSNLTALTLRGQSLLFVPPIPPKLRSLHFEGSVASLQSVRSETLTRLTLDSVFNMVEHNVAELFPNLWKLAFICAGVVARAASCDEIAWIAKLPRLTSLKFDLVDLSKCGIIDARGDILGPSCNLFAALPVLRTLSLGRGAFAINVHPFLQIRRIPASVAKLLLHEPLWDICSANLRDRARTVTVSQSRVCARFF